MGIAEMAKRAPDTAPENRMIFTSSGICDLTRPTETQHGFGNVKINRSQDRLTIPGATSTDSRIAGQRDIFISLLHPPIGVWNMIAVATLIQDNSGPVYRTPRQADVRLTDSGGGGST